MARSGSQTTWSSNGGYFLKVTWSETSQSIANNTTSIEVKLYFGCKSGWSINDSTNSYTLTIDGTTYSGSDVSLSTSTSGDLITTRTRTITHNSDGRKSITIDASISGLYFGGISLSAFTATFDTIPRASSITSSASWTAGYDLKVSISRYSSSFDHDVIVKVNGVQVGSTTGVGTSVVFTGTTFHTNVFTALAQGSSKSTEVIITTKDGSTKIGSSASKDGTVKAPDATTITAGNFNIGDNRKFTLNQGLPAFKHTVKLIMANGGTVKTMTNVESSNEMVFTTSEINEMYSRTSTLTSIPFTMEVTSYYNGVQVRNPRESSTYRAYVVNANPTAPTTVSYVDENTTITGITGNNKYIVQGKSTVGVTFNAGVAVKGATISRYYVTGTGASSPKITTSVTKQNIGTLNASSNATVTVTVEDSRGNKASRTIPVTIVPYKPPTLSSEATRLDNFQPSTTISFSGSLSLVNIAGVVKNSITSLTYKSKLSSVATYGSASSNVATTLSGSTFSGTRTTSFPNTASYDIEITVVDRFGSTSKQVVTISSGQPLLFLDTLNSAVGINAFPEPLLSTVDPANVALDIGITHGRVSFFSKPSVASNNEVTMRIQPADDLSDNKAGFHLFARRDSHGLHSSKDNTTFLRYTNLNNTNTTASTSEPKGSLKLLAQSNLDLYAKTFLNLIVEDSDGTPVPVLRADGTKDVGGVWVELGGGSRTHIVAGERNINPDADLNFGPTSESIVIEANSNTYMFWGTQSGFNPSYGVIGASTAFRPHETGTLTLGHNNFRWQTIYSVNALSTSDSSTKEGMIQLNDFEIKKPRFKYSHWKKENEISPDLIYKEMKNMPLFLFQYKDMSHIGSQIGFMADQLLQDDKTGVAKRFVYREEEDGIASVSTQSYVATIHVALQEEMKKTDKLENEIKELTKRLEMLEK